MKISVFKFIRWCPFIEFVLVISLISSCKRIFTHSDAESSLPVTVTGVQHLGGDYLINRFYINKELTDSVGESGGGGSRMCCIALPKKWRPNLKADVRWEVHRIVRPAYPTQPETAEIVAIYQAQVPVEKYDEPALFWIHFFSDGRARIVVTPFGFDGEKHPIRWGDEQAGQVASKGKILEKFFSIEELAEIDRQLAIDRKKYGDWR